MQYVELDENENIVKVVPHGMSYKHVSVPKNADKQVYLDLGLFEYVVEPEPTLSAGQKFGTRYKVVDHTTKQYIVRTPVVEPTAEEAYLIALNAWKAQRADLVRAILVDYKDTQFQGDEESQNKMARAISVLPDEVTTVDWLDVNNVVHALNAADFRAILANAGAQQVAVWNIGRPVQP